MRDAGIHTSAECARATTLVASAQNAPLIEFQPLPSSVFHLLKENTTIFFIFVIFHLLDVENESL